MTESDWLSSEDPAALLEWVTKSSLPRLMNVPPSPRKLRLFACACCRQAWHLLTDPRSRRAVEVAERYADGEVTEEELADARNGAFYASRHQTGSAETGAHDASCGYPGDGDYAVVEWPIRAAILREIIGNPYRPVTLPTEKCPRCDGKPRGVHSPLGGWTTCETCWGRLVVYPWLAWNDGVVVRLARAAYEERREDGRLCPARLQVLADALEEAGCQDDGLLRHLRGWDVCPACVEYRQRDRIKECGGYYRGCVNGWIPLRGPHVRGCWPLDLILGKS